MKDQVKVWVSEPFVILLIIELNNFYADDFDNVQIYNNNDNLYYNFMIHIKYQKYQMNEL